MADLEKIVDDISALTLLEAAELTKMLEEKLGRFRRSPYGHGYDGHAWGGRGRRRG